MNIEEAITIYNQYQNNEEIKKYEEARSIILREMENRKPKKEYYKSSKKKHYYLELPYENINITSKGIEKQNNSYNIIYQAINSNESGNYCLSLCGYSKEKMINLIEKDIIEDNVLKED